MRASRGGLGCQARRKRSLRVFCRTLSSEAEAEERAEKRGAGAGAGAGGKTMSRRRNKEIAEQQNK